MIRRAEPTDRAWMIAAGELVFRDLGDYHAVLASWLDAPGILAWVDFDEADEERRGFAMLGFYLEAETPVADLLALVVLPEFQNKGIGTDLLNYVVRMAGVVGPKRGISELRLTVAESNTAGHRLYLRHRFSFASTDADQYSSGERALRMVRGLP